jgi:hypothetical protein
MEVHPVNSTTSEEHLAAFLAPKGVQVTDLLGQVDASFGEPLLIVAAGSVLEGFGNQESDVDLLVFVDAPKVTDFPISSHTLGLPLDVNYIDASWAKESGQLIISGVLHQTAAFGRGEWKRSYRRLTRLGRTSIGAVLGGDADWLDWQQELRAAFPRYAVSWWRTEAVRQRCAANLLASQRPLLAAQRCCDAALAVLESLAAQGGELYVGPKWIGAKLRRLAVPEYVRAFERVIDLPTTSAEANDYMREVGDLMSELTSDHPLPTDPDVALNRLPGVQRWEVRGRVLVQRWGLRGVELGDDSDIDHASDDGVLWRGRISKLSGAALAIAEQDLAWLSVEEGVAA